MTAVASMGGVIASTEPGGVPVTPPWSDSITRADASDPGQPWYTPGCSVPPLTVVSNTLQVPTVGTWQSGILLDTDDFDLSFDVHYAAANGDRDDVQVEFRRTACWHDAKHYLWATMPDLSLGGTQGIVLYEVDNETSFTLVDFNGSGGLAEGSTFTFRIHVHGTTCDLYINGGAPFMTDTISPIAGQQAVSFLMAKPGSYIDNVSVA